MNNPFRFEYRNSHFTKKTSYGEKRSFTEEMDAMGYVKVWSDQTDDGEFVVYRRDTQAND